MSIRSSHCANRHLKCIQYAVVITDLSMLFERGDGVEHELMVLMRVQAGNADCTDQNGPDQQRNRSTNECKGRKVDSALLGKHGVSIQEQFQMHGALAESTKCGEFALDPVLMIADRPR